MTYRQRREARAERLGEWADKRETAAAAVFEAGEPYRGDIAFATQPGHIPLRARVIAREDRAHESLRKAQSMKSRAAGIEDQLARSIYSDDPDAIEALEQRITTLEGERERIKAYNSSCRKGTPNLEVLDAAQRHEVKSLALVAAWQMKGGAFPSYVLSNLSGNIKRNRDRLAELRRQRERTAKAETAGGTSIADYPSGHCSVTFAEKPAREMLDALRGAGFRWSKGSWYGQRDQLPAELEQAQS